MGSHRSMAIPLTLIKEPVCRASLFYHGDGSKQILQAKDFQPRWLALLQTRPWTPLLEGCAGTSHIHWLQVHSPVLNLRLLDPTVCTCAVSALWNLSAVFGALHTSDAPQKRGDGCDWSVGGNENWIYWASYYSLFCCCGLAADLY